MTKESSNDRRRVIIYLDASRYEYLAWLAEAKRERINATGLALLEKALDDHREHLQG